MTTLTIKKDTTAVLSNVYHYHIHSTDIISTQTNENIAFCKTLDCPFKHNTTQAQCISHVTVIVLLM